MSIYQSSVLKKFLAGQDESQIQAAFEAYSKFFLDAAIQQNIRNSKEKQFQEGFMRELFVKIFSNLELTSPSPAPSCNTGRV